ncbi:Dimethylaniline Monooxygenase [N-Oxide-Forming] 2 [Manis pentadactyla]|nr:Dimethylaniline Monooxygenase [N-Oxide-Forming] 2 [Manis pentadactyla]
MTCLPAVFIRLPSGTEGPDFKSRVRYFMADYKAESREKDETFSDRYYLLDEPKACFQIHFQCDFPVGYVLDAMEQTEGYAISKVAHFMPVHMIKAMLACLLASSRCTELRNAIAQAQKKEGIK